jgi:hypothetical protein
MRYNHERRFAARGAVNAVPENCSAYNPNGQRCGELRPWGSAPAKASVANSLPKPLKYPVDAEAIARTVVFYDIGPTAQRQYSAACASVAHEFHRLKPDQRHLFVAIAHIAGHADGAKQVPRMVANQHATGRGEQFAAHRRHHV